VDEMTGLGEVDRSLDFDPKLIIEPDKTIINVESGTVMAEGSNVLDVSEDPGESMWIRMESSISMPCRS